MDEYGNYIGGGHHYDLSKIIWEVFNEGEHHYDVYTYITLYDAIIEEVTKIVDQKR